MDDTEGTQIIGHRGAGGHAPENTEAAIAAGIRLGASALEVDIQFTADGMPVVFHDRTLERMAGVRGKIRDQTARELAGYDIGFKFGDDYRGLRILTLDEAARLLPREIALHVEIKDYDTVSASNLKEVLGSLKRRGLLDRSLISSFSEKILSALRGLDPKVRLGLLVSGRARGSAERAAALHCYSLHPEAGQTDRDLVEDAHARGLKVFPFTANDPDQMKQLLAMGVDGLYTDYPGRLAEIVGHRPRAARTAQTRASARHESPSRHEASQRRAGRRPAGAETSVETLTGEPVEESKNSRSDLASPPASHEVLPAALETEGSAAEAGEHESAEDSLRRKRRRGRRGGRRHRRKTAAPGPPDLTPPFVTAGSETSPVEAIEEAEEPEPLEIEASPEEPISIAGENSQGPDLLRKRRRRGRRGGRRHRRGAGPKDPAGGESPAGGEA